MTWTYDASQLTEPLNRLRFLVQDTDEADPLVQNEEIEFTLEEEGGNLYRAASAVCEAIALQLGRQLSLKGKIELSADEQYKHYLDLAERYRLKGGRKGIKPFAGGLSKSEKITRSTDSDRIEPAFRRDLHDLLSSEPAGGER